MDDLSKFVSEMIQKFPDPDDFIKELEKTDKPDKEKGNYLFEIGNTLHKISNFKLAIKVWKLALEYYQKDNNKIGEFNCFKNSSESYRKLGEFQKAIEYQESALVIAKEIGDESLEARSYNNLGIVYTSIGEFYRAIKYYKKSLAIFSVAGDKFAISHINQNLGIAYRNLGDNRRAIEYYEKSLEIKKKIGDKLGEANGYNNLSASYLILGNFRQAIEYYQKSIEILKEIGNKSEEAHCYNNIAVTYSDLGDHRRAIEYHEKSLVIKKAIGDKFGEANSYMNLGTCYYKSDDFQQAIEYFEKSLGIYKILEDKSGEANFYSNIGSVYLKLDDYRRAIEYYNKSLKFYKNTGDKSKEANCYQNLGISYGKFGDFKKANEYYQKALAIYKEIGEVFSKKGFHIDFGEFYLDKKIYNQAEKQFKQAIDIIESMRKENIPNEYKRNFWKDNIPIFDNLIISDLKLGKNEEALENSERGKGRTVLDFILSRGIEEKFKPKPLNFKEIQELARRIEKNLVLFRVTEKGTYSFTLNPDGKFDLLEIPEFTTKRLEELTVGLEAGKPTDSWIHAYSNYKSVTDRIKPLLLKEKVVEAGKLLKQEEEKWFKTMDNTLKTLYDELLGKVFSRFKKGEKVVIIPNRALNILPLHACFYEGTNETNDSESSEYTEASGKRSVVDGKRRYLLDDYEISYAPNCNILDLCEKREKGERRRKHDFFAIANPAPPYNLAFSEWEVEEIGKLFDTKEVYIKEEVKDKLLDKIADYGIIHLSTHGIYDLGSSFNSRLRLGKEVDLTLEEIFEKIRIDNSWLVSLSACESGLVDYRDIADEYIGLQTGFLYAGAPTVIASLWTVADFTTAFIMIKTYEYIFKDGLTKAEALRKAQLWLKDLTAGEALNILAEKELELEYSIKMAAGDLMPLRISIKSEDPESKPFAHPYYWAGFQLFGA